MKRSLAALLLLSGCALMRKGEPLHVRYFVPETDEHAAPLAPRVARAEPLRVRLGRVSGGAELGQRIVLRQSGGEVSFHDDLRWTERPEEYLRRDLARVLFEEKGLSRVVSGPGPTLDVELVAFEEVRAERHEARFRAVIILHSERDELLERTVLVTAPVQGDDANASVRALGVALSRAVSAIAEAVESTLVAHGSPANAG